MSLTRKVAFSTIIQVIGKVLVTAISLITISYLTRYLGVTGYGNYTTIFAYVSFWAVLADFGFFWVLVRELAKPDSEKNFVFNNIITVKIIFSLAVFSLCSVISFLIPQYDQTLKIGISLIAASWFWMSLNSTYVGLFQSQLEMYKAVVSEVLGRAIILVGVLWLIFNNYSFEAILSIYILGNIINVLINYLWGQKHVKFKLAFDIKFWRIILKDSLPLALLSIIGVVHFKIDTVILSLMKGPTDVGIYGVPFKILEIATVIPAIFIGNVFPILTKYYHAKDNRLNGSIQKSFDFLMILAVPIMVWLMVLAKPIINLIGGNEYITTSTVSFAGYDISAPIILVILAFYVAVSFLLYIFSNILTVINRQSSQLVPMLIVTLINIGLNITLVPYFSYLASAVIACITVVIMFFWWFVLSHRYLNFKLNYKSVPKSVFAGLIMALALFIFGRFNVILSTILGFIVYFGVGVAIKLLDADVLKKMIPFLERSKDA